VDTPVSNQLTAESESLRALSYPMTEEFQVIGLRPMEFRPAVIRRAMNRSAAPLATAHLHHPDGAVEKKLALVATAGYRLLDPRRREDSLHRMMLGRIHPQLADEAARIAQAKGNQLTDSDASESDETIQFAGGGLIRVRNQRNEPSNRNRSQNRFVDDSASHWNYSLRSSDLLIEPPIRRLFRTTRRWALQRYIAVASVSGLVMMTLVTWRISRDEDAVAVADVARETDSSTIRKPTSDSPGQPGAVEAIVEKPIASESIVEATFKPIPETATIPAEIESTSVGVQLSQQPVIAPPFVNAIIAAETDEGTDVPSPGDQLAMPVAGAVAIVEATIETEIPTVSRLPVPLDVELMERRDAWKLFLSQGPDSDSQGKASRSFQFAEEALGGTIDRWIGLRGAAMFSTLAGNFEFSDRALLRISDAFETDIATLAKDVAVDAIAAPMGADETTNLVHWLEGWIGRSLVAGKLDDAAFFVANVNQLTRSLSDPALSERSKEMTRSLETARRLADATDRMESVAEESLSASEQLAAGRYWGLIRHQWPKALPFLIAGSDARLTSLATSESLLGGLPEPNELIDLAEGYLAFAKKSKGWQQTSYILHAAEILDLDAAPGANAQTLELNRLQKQLRTEHESIFALAELLTVAVPAFVQPLERASAPDLVLETESGLIGRILVGGEDVGVMLRYEPGAPLTTKTLEQIGDRLKFDISAASIQLVGTLVIDRPTAIAVVASNVIIDGKNSVSLDDHDLTMIPSEAGAGKNAVFLADLSPGNWTIRWNLPALDKDGSTFRVTDSLSGMPIKVLNPPRTIKDHPETMKTRLRVSMITGQ